MNRNNSQLKAGVVLNYVTIFLNLVIGLVYTPYLLRMLGQEEYGLYSLAASVIAYLTVLDLGFGNAIVRYTSKFIAEGKKRAAEEMYGMFWVMYLIVGVVAMAAGGLLAVNADTVFGANMSDYEVGRMRIILWIMTFNLAFSFPMSIWESILMAHERFVFIRVVKILRTLLNPLVMLVLLFFGYKALALVVVTTVFNVLSLVANCWYCLAGLKVKLRFARPEPGFLKEVGLYSFWIFLGVLMDRIYWSTGQFVLGVVSGTVAVAVYAVAIKLQSMYMMFSTAISSVFLPKVTKMVAVGDNRKEISDLFIRTGRLQYLIMALLLSGFVVFGRQFIALWAGKGYGDAYVIALLFLVPLTVPLIQNLGITILQARNQMKFRSVVYICIAILSLVLAIVLGREYGGIGCAAATSGALVLGQIVVMNIYYSRRQGIDIWRFWGEIAKMSIVPLVLMCSFMALSYSGIISFDSINGFMCYALLYVSLYVVLMWCFAMNDYERRLIKGMLKGGKK